VFAFVSKDGYDTDFFAKSSTVLTTEKCEANTTLVDVQLKMATDMAQRRLQQESPEGGVGPTSFSTSGVSTLSVSQGIAELETPS
jgi:hypothetical protein